MLRLPHLPKLTIGDMDVPLPIIQGGMGVGVSLSSLASAVADEGGVGVISAAILKGADLDGEPRDSLVSRLEFLRREIARSRRRTKGAIGVNILVALTDYDDYFQLSVERGVECIFLGAGLPLKLPPIVADAGAAKLHTKLIPIVSSGRAVELILRSWEKRYGRSPDAFVVEGPLAGGHLGFSRKQLKDPAFALEHLVGDVLEVVAQHSERLGRSIPVIAAGGVYTGGDVEHFLELGAAGVQMATRFVTTHECDAAAEFKQAYLNAKQEDIVIIDSPLGLPGRAVNNDFLRAAERGEKEPRNCSLLPGRAVNNDFLRAAERGEKEPRNCSWKCMKTCDQRQAHYCIAGALEQARRGNLQHGFTFAGANAYLADEIISVKELFGSLLFEYQVAVFRRRFAEAIAGLRRRLPVFRPQSGS